MNQRDQAMWHDTQHQTDRYGSPGRAADVLRSKRPMIPNWWDDCGEIASLLRWLYASHNFDAEELIPVVEKPWKWSNEYVQMLSERTPDVDTSAALIDAGE